MPQLFARMTLGAPLCTLFFLGLTFAGFSSLIAQLELPTRVLIDAGMKRSWAIGVVVACVYLIGIPSARSINFLVNQDFVWGIALMLSGAFVAFTVIRFGARKLRSLELLPDKRDWNIGRWWDYVMTYFIPVGATILLIWWLWVAAAGSTPSKLWFKPLWWLWATTTGTNNWYNPFFKESVMTCLIQWASIFIILILLNQWLGDRFYKQGSLQKNSES
jgi:NSS family neurotransmitter:Na+ symporter